MIVRCTKRVRPRRRLNSPTACRIAGSLGILILPACSAAAAGGGGYCRPPVAAAFSSAPGTASSDVGPRDVRMATLLGLGGVTASLAARSSETRARVVERVGLASLAIESTAAELECESERAEQAADYLTRGQTSAVQALTIGSIVAATLTSIAGVLLSTSARPAAEQDVVALSGGVVTAGLGLGSLFVHPQVDFDHARNLLSDVWFGPQTSTTYPPIVWAYLSRPEVSNGGREPIRVRIVGRWKQFRQVDDPKTAATLFGAGGSYDAEALHLRAAMLAQVKAEVELTNQELVALSATLLE